MIFRPSWLPPFRPLPFACAAMALLLAVKLQVVVHAIGGAPAALMSAGRAVVPTAQAAGHGGEHAKPAPAAAAPPAVPSAASPAPAEPPIPDSERAVLLDLRARRTQMEAREQALATREAVLAAAEKRMGERVDQLSALQARLEALDGTRRERDEANWRGLVKTYEIMRPRDAAAILNEMEMPVLLQVLDRMKEAKAAAVLAAMQPDRARAATAQLAAMRSQGVAPPGAPG